MFLPYFSRFCGFIAQCMIFCFCAVWWSVCGKFRSDLGAKPTPVSYLTLLNF
ncbi:hypothetical protein CSUNSWCD_713 [Campylobacter showae CSUNSWCD]|uniref:Uncharacterized protein n=1 Tax=Campylobacter showae CSUNSWCD TaxID=1244083 RepID=M5IP07_9BACT|nr:hypothetical protein CSUNSWCD_713 [Campylobacter showae CSUNSWCD]